MNTSGCKKKLWASLTVCIREKQGQNAEQRQLTFLLKAAEGCIIILRPA